MKITKNQNKIIEVLEKNDALSAQTIADKLPEIDQSTVYRNLNKLVSTGVLRELFLNKVESKFEITDTHQHAVCTDCGMVKHIKLDLEQVKKLIPSNIDFEVDEIELVIRGKCKNS